MNEIREWIGFGCELYICLILTLEYYYDLNKDALKTRRKTTKKRTTTSDGHVTEESTEETIAPQEEPK